MTIACLLAESRAAHQRYSSHRGRINKEGGIGQHPNIVACGAAVRDALRLRAEAHNQDPRGEDPAWIEDRILMRVNSEWLLHHYVRYLAPEAHIAAV